MKCVKIEKNSRNILTKRTGQIWTFPSISERNDVFINDSSNFENRLVFKVSVINTPFEILNNPEEIIMHFLSWLNFHNLELDKTPPEQILHSLNCCVHNLKSIFDHSHNFSRLDEKCVCM